MKREWLKFYEPAQLPQQFSYILQSWDTANKTEEINDYSVCTTWGSFNEEFYLLDVFRRRLTYPTLKRAVEEHFRKYTPYKLLIEDKASGIALIQEIQAEGFCAVELYKPPPGSDKFMRFAAQTIKFESGKVYLPQQAPWLDEYVREITGFPGTKHDDQVDSTAQALAVLGSYADGLAAWMRLGS